jgi:hypothetical protein
MPSWAALSLSRVSAKETCGLGWLYATAQDGAGPASAADCFRFCSSFSGQKRAFWGREAGTDAR